MITEDGSSTIEVAEVAGIQCIATERTTGVSVVIDKTGGPDPMFTITYKGVTVGFPAEIASHVHDCLGRVM